MTERGATEDEVIATFQTGERFPAKYGREGFRWDFVFQGVCVVGALTPNRLKPSQPKKKIVGL